MEKRLLQLSELKTYIQNTEKETALLLQNLQWNKKSVLERSPLVSCRWDPGHRVPGGSLARHESACLLTHFGYSEHDQLLPDPSDANTNTVVKLTKADINVILSRAAQSDPTFKRGCVGPEPLSAARLEQAYTADERRAIHDAVVDTAPACHDLTDLALISPNEKHPRAKSRLEVLSELRDMKRRRTKYRVAPKTKNYSHVLKDVIKTQMDLYAEANGIFIKTEYCDGNIASVNKTTETPQVIKQEPTSHDRYSASTSRERQSIDHNQERAKDRHRNSSRDNWNNGNPIRIKQERISPETQTRQREQDISRTHIKDKSENDRRQDRHEKREIDRYNRRHDRDERHSDRSRHDSRDKASHYKSDRNSTSYSKSDRDRTSHSKSDRDRTSHSKSDRDRTSHSKSDRDRTSHSKSDRDRTSNYKSNRDRTSHPKSDRDMSSHSKADRDRTYKRYYDVPVKKEKDEDYYDRKRHKY